MRIVFSMKNVLNVELFFSTKVHYINLNEDEAPSNIDDKKRKKTCEINNLHTYLLHRKGSKQPRL